MKESIEIEKLVYDKNQYERTINTKFTQISPDSLTPDQIDDDPTVEDFFELYNELFYEIPQNGETDSHEFIIQKSSEYINFDPNQDEIEALQREIGELRTELLEEQQKNLELITGVSSSTPTITQGNNTVGQSSGTPSYT